MSRLNKIQPSDVLLVAGPSIKPCTEKLKGLATTNKLSSATATAASAAGNQNQASDLLLKPQIKKQNPASIRKGFIASSTNENQLTTTKLITNSNNYNRRQESCKDWLLDAIYFICPDCSCVQCSAILFGLSLIVCLLIIFLYLGSYWDTKLNKEEKI